MAVIEIPEEKHLKLTDHNFTDFTLREAAASFYRRFTKSRPDHDRRTSTLIRLSYIELALYIGFAYLINWTCIFSSGRTGLNKRRLFLSPSP
jgi:hypothetical protein